MVDLETDYGSFSLLRFRDFVPEQLSKNVWTARGTYEPMEDKLIEINQWLMANPQLALVNVETVVLPNLHSPKEEGSEDPEILITAGSGLTYHQFFRVWYIESTEV